MSANNAALARYYRLHAGIYDATRWSFLFGREELLRQVRCKSEPARILEVGCGTGRNLARLAHWFPAAELTGIDLSESMLAKARRRLGHVAQRVSLLHAAYEQPLGGDRGFDLIVASYALSMFNPGWDAALRLMHDDLSPQGRVAIVDFHASPLAGFQRWMHLNHVRMGGHLRDGISTLFAPETDCVRPAYGGLWQYFMFTGRPV